MMAPKATGRSRRMLPSAVPSLEIAPDIQTCSASSYLANARNSDQLRCGSALRRGRLGSQLGFALDGQAAGAVGLAAIRDALDRTGFKPGVEIELSAKPYEQILDRLHDLKGAAGRSFVARKASSTPNHNAPSSSEPRC